MSLLVDMIICKSEARSAKHADCVGMRGEKRKQHKRYIIPVRPLKDLYLYSTEFCILKASVLHTNTSVYRITNKLKSITFENKSSTLQYHFYRHEKVFLIKNIFIAVLESDWF